MKIYKLEPIYLAGNLLYEGLWPVGEADWNERWNFAGTPKLDHWDIDSTVVRPVDGAGSVGDFPYLAGDVLVLGERAFSTLQHLLYGCGELLPIRCIDGRSFVLCNLLPCYDCLDEASTLGQRFKDGRWMFIERYQLTPKLVPRLPLFKIVGGRSSIFCSEAFKQAVEAAGLKGLEFREIWNDDGGPTQVIKQFDRIC